MAISIEGYNWLHEVSRVAIEFKKHIVFPTFYGKGPHPLLWGGSRASRGKITRGISKCLNYCKIFVVCTQFINVAASRKIQPGGQHAACGPQDGDQ